MKYSVFLLVIALGFFACHDDDNVSFDVSMSKENIRFKAAPGGAVMYYNLPENDEVFALNVRYTDARGGENLKVGGYGSDSLIIDGFTAACKGVPARVCLVNRNAEESAFIEVMFDTEDSAPYSFFESTEVAPYWGGFQLTCDSRQQASGTAHVFYLGTNPLTHLTDTILVSSFPINKGLETHYFTLQQDRDVNTVVVRTEDNRGFRVNQKIWENVESYKSEKLSLSPREFTDVYGLSQESDEEKVGIQYLFDGDTKGTQRMKAQVNKEVYTFLAGPAAVGAPFIVDLKGPKIPASVRIYAILNMPIGFTFENYMGVPQSPLAVVWKGNYVDKLPCAVTVYGGNDKDGNEWQELGFFSQSPDDTNEYRWSERCHTLNTYEYTQTDELEAAEPAYLEILLPAQEITYRYLKLVVDEVFNIPKQFSDRYNLNKYVSIHELEVYIKKD